MREDTKEKLKDLTTVTIVFDYATSHNEVLLQFVEKMVKAKFASRKEIIENMKMVDTFINFNN